MNKNKALTLLFLVFSYFSIVCLDNSKNIVLYFFKDVSFNFDYINLLMVISLILIMLMCLYKPQIDKHKNLFSVMLTHILFYNIVYGLFPTLNTVGILLLEVYLLFITYLVMVTSKKEFAISFVISFSSILCIVFAFGVLHCLIFSKYFILLTIIFGILFIFKTYKAAGNKLLVKCFDDLFGFQGCLFYVLFFMSILGGVGYFVHTWDEYSFWAYDAKATIYFDKIDIYLGHGTYPPMLSIWYYVFNIFAGPFAEQNLYIGISMFICFYLMPAFLWLKDRSFIVRVLCVVSVVFCCSLFGGVYTYSTLYADFAIATIFGASLIFYYYGKDKCMEFNVALALTIVIMTLIKPNGFVISFVLIFIIFVDYMVSSKYGNKLFESIFSNFIGFFKKNWKYIVILLMTYGVWVVAVKITGKFVDKSYGMVLMPDSLKSDILPKLNKTFVFSFIHQALNSFDENLAYGLINLTLWQYLIVLFASLFVVFYFENNYCVKTALKKLLPLVLGYFLFWFLTLLSMFVALSYYEAEIFASFGRYVNWFHLGSLIFVLSYLSKISSRSRTVAFGVLTFYVIVIMGIPFMAQTYYVTSYSEKKSTENISNERSEKFEIINKYTTADDKVYVIDQEEKDGIMAMWYARYYAFPRVINASSLAITWKIKTEKNADDLRDWGLTAETWEKHLIDYNFDYVFLYSADDEFFEKTQYMYDDYTTAKDYSLFKINYDGSDFQLVAVK